MGPRLNAMLTKRYQIHAAFSAVVKSHVTFAQVHTLTRQYTTLSGVTFLTTACECRDCEQDPLKPTTAVKMKLLAACCLLVLAGILSTDAYQASCCIKSNAVTHVKRLDSSSVVHVHRQRRQAQTLTTNDKTEIVDQHNRLRAMEGADNMELMVGPFCC